MTVAVVNASLLFIVIVKTMTEVTITVQTLILQIMEQRSVFGRVFRGRVAD